MSLEWYFAPGGLLSAAVFGKKIRDPIFTQVSTQENVVIAGQTFTRARFTQPLNGGKANLIGIELVYQQRLDFLPGLLSGLGVAGTLTLADSNLDGTPFPEQSNVLWGAQMFYQKGPIDATLGLSPHRPCAACARCDVQRGSVQ